MHKGTYGKEMVTKKKSGKGSGKKLVGNNTPQSAKRATGLNHPHMGNLDVKEMPVHRMKRGMMKTGVGSDKV